MPQVTEMPPIHHAEYVMLGGIEQFVFHRGSDEGKPVVLYLHGGPGMPFSNKAWRLSAWDEYFTTIFWDQRGAGKTALRNPEAAPDFRILLEDLNELVDLLRARYNQDKIIIMGHSWGSVLGTLYTMRFPEKLHCYIGVGQVVSARDDERLGFTELYRRAQNRDDRSTLSRLDELEPYPGEDVKQFLPKLMEVRQLQFKYGMASFDADAEAQTIRQSPLYTICDDDARAIAVSLLGKLYEEFSHFDLFKMPAEFHVPVHFLLGAEDWQVPSSQGARYFELLHAPTKTLTMIPNARHVPHLENSEAFLEELLRIRGSL